jgi:hypothetical protein
LGAEVIGSSVGEATELMVGFGLVDSCIFVTAATDLGADDDITAGEAVVAAAAALAAGCRVVGRNGSLS